MTKSKSSYHNPPPWFRLYNELADDPKIRRIAVMTEQHELVIIGLWVKLLIIANKSPVRGELRMSAELPYSLDDIQYDVRMDKTDLISLVEAFIKLEMLSKVDGCYIVSHFEDRQFKSDSDGAERVKRYRQRKKREENQDEKSNDDKTLQVDECNVTVTPPESESESDTKTEEENSDYGRICTLYENNISTLTPIIAQDISTYLDECSADWITRAITIASENNVRKWKYIKAILDRWIAAGQISEESSKNGNDPVYRDIDNDQQAIMKIAEIIKVELGGDGDAARRGRQLYFEHRDWDYQTIAKAAMA